MKYLFVISSLFLSATVLAAETVAPVKPVAYDPVSSEAVFQLVGGLALVILLIVLVAWLLRRATGLQRTGSSMKVLASLPLGTRERAVLIQAGEQQLLLGVTAGQVTLLHAFDTPVVTQENGGNESAFSGRLKEVLQQKGLM